jgi:glycerate 2-kinase
VRVIAAGKAAPVMAQAAARWFGPRLRGGVVVAPRGAVDEPALESVQAGHPVPDEGSVSGARRALEVAEALAPDETLVVLLSGGASALLAAPADGVSLSDLRAVTAQLLRGGADIEALNTVRRHLSGIQGGWLAARTPGASVTFAVSDVVGDDPSAIGSGPTVGDSSTFAEALRVLEGYGGLDAYPVSVIRRFERGAAGEVPETPKPEDPRLARATWRLIGGRGDAMAGALAEAGTRGYAIARISNAVVGEARKAGVTLLTAAAAHANNGGRPACIVSSGETTVRVVGAGRGGRNQELVLGAVEALALTPGALLASAGTDGVDGPTDAAGAVADTGSLARALAAGLRPDDFLRENDAYAFFQAMGDLIHSDPTGTNVGDLQVVLLA